MVLCQILVTPAAAGGATANGQYQVVPVTGKCCIRVLGIQYHDNAAATVTRFIQIISDNLVFPYSTTRFLTFLTNPVTSYGLDVSRLDYHLNDQILNGQLLIQVVDKATGVEPGNFTHCIINLDIELIDQQHRVGQ